MHNFTDGNGRIKNVASAAASIIFLSYRQRHFEVARVAAGKRAE